MPSLRSPRASIVVFSLCCAVIACGEEVSSTAATAPRATGGSSGANANMAGRSGAGANSSGSAGTMGEAPGGAPCDDQGGGTCGPTEYCSYANADACGVGGTCVKRPGGCITIGNPSTPCLCGGARTQGSCDAIVSHGDSPAPFASECQPSGGPVACSNAYDSPACGTREFCDVSGADSCAGQGLCRPLPSECPQKGTEPVCGCDGKRRLNACNVNVLGVSVAPSPTACDTAKPPEP